MKKLMMLFVAAAAISFAACKSETKGGENAQQEQTQVVEDSTNKAQAPEVKEGEAAPEAKQGEAKADEKAAPAEKKEAEKAK